jgi:UDP:flavonoid glycosyltransferase YjiC (YdhE family)
VKPIKNKKRHNPRYQLNEAYGIDPTYAPDHNYGSGVHQSQMMTQEPYEVIKPKVYRDLRDDGTLLKPSAEDEERLRDLFPEHEIIDPSNYRDIQRVTYKQPHGDPNAIIPLGTESDGAFIYAKTGDGIYYRAARGGYGTR